MTETDDLLREMLAESRVQTTHLHDMKECMKDTCTTEDIRRAEQMMLKASQDRKDEHKLISKTVEKSTTNGNTDFYQKLILILIVALFAAFGLTKYAEYVAAGG